MEKLNNNVDGIDFNFIIKSGFNNELTIEQSLHLAYLMGLTKSVKIKLYAETINSLIKAQLIDEKTKPLPAALRVFRRFKTDNTELAKTIRDMYPSGMKDGTWPWRGTISLISDRLDMFNKMYPDISNDEITRATQDYLNRFSEDGGRSLLMYFIWKSMSDGTKRSLLAEWVYANREMKVKQKTNTEQL
jgi:hypothetical protein